MTTKESLLINSNSAKDFIVWNPKLELGISTIDAQHKKLVELCNNLYKTLMNRENQNTSNYKASIAQVLHECVDYVKTHFKAEEKCLITINYVDFEKHKKTHETFIAKILETSKNFEELSFSDAIKFVKFLYDWILTHIAYEDKLYVKYVIEYLAKKK